MKRIFSLRKKKRGGAAASSLPEAYAGVVAKSLPKLHRAAFTGDINKLEDLLRRADVTQRDKSQRTALHYAAAAGHVPCALKLATSPHAESTLTAYDSDGMTPLIRAIEAMHTACAKQLLEAGSNPELVDAEHQAPLHWATYMEDKQVALLLLQKGADVNVPDRNGQTPLHIAVDNQLEDFSTMFAQRTDSEVNAVDAKGRTPLMLAASKGDDFLVDMLLGRGATLDIEDNEGYTALGYAQANNHTNIMSRLVPPKPASARASVQPSPPKPAAAAAAPATGGAAAAQSAPPPEADGGYSFSEDSEEDGAGSDKSIDFGSDPPSPAAQRISLDIGARLAAMGRSPGLARTPDSTAPSTGNILDTGFIDDESSDDEWAEEGILQTQGLPAGTPRKPVGGVETAEGRLLSEWRSEAQGTPLSSHSESASALEKTSARLGLDMPNVTLDERKTPSKAIYSPHGSVMGFAGTVEQGTELVGLKLGPMDSGEAAGEDHVFAMSPLTPAVGKLRARTAAAASDMGKKGNDSFGGDSDWDTDISEDDAPEDGLQPASSDWRSTTSFGKTLQESESQQVLRQDEELLLEEAERIAALRAKGRGPERGEDASDEETENVAAASPRIDAKEGMAKSLAAEQRQRASAAKAKKEELSRMLDELEAQKRQHAELEGRARSGPSEAELADATAAEEAEERERAAAAQAAELQAARAAEEEEAEEARLAEEQRRAEAEYADDDDWDQSASEVDSMAEETIDESLPVGGGDDDDVSWAGEGPSLPEAGTGDTQQSLAEVDRQLEEQERQYKAKLALAEEQERLALQAEAAEGERLEREAEHARQLKAMEARTRSKVEGEWRQRLEDSRGDAEAEAAQRRRADGLEVEVRRLEQEARALLGRAEAAEADRADLTDALAAEREALAQETARREQAERRAQLAEVERANQLDEQTLRTSTAAPTPSLGEAEVEARAKELVAVRLAGKEGELQAAKAEVTRLQDRLELEKRDLERQQADLQRQREAQLQDAERLREEITQRGKDAEQRDRERAEHDQRLLEKEKAILQKEADAERRTVERRAAELDAKAAEAQDAQAAARRQAEEREAELAAREKALHAAELQLRTQEEALKSWKIQEEQQLEDQRLRDDEMVQRTKALFEDERRRRSEEDEQREEQLAVQEANLQTREDELALKLEEEQRAEEERQAEEDARQLHGLHPGNGLLPTASSQAASQTFFEAVRATQHAALLRDNLASEAARHAQRAYLDGVDEEIEQGREELRADLGRSQKLAASLARLEDDADDLADDEDAALHIAEERQRARRLQHLGDEEEPVEPAENMSFYALGMHDGVASQVVGGHIRGHHSQQSNPHTQALVQDLQRQLQEHLKARQQAEQDLRLAQLSAVATSERPSASEVEESLLQAETRLDEKSRELQLSEFARLAADMDNLELMHKLEEASDRTRALEAGLKDAKLALSKAEQRLTDEEAMHGLAKQGKTVSDDEADVLRNAMQALSIEKQELELRLRELMDEVEAKDSLHRETIQLYHILEDDAKRLAADLREKETLFDVAVVNEKRAHDEFEEASREVAILKTQLAHEKTLAEEQVVALQGDVVELRREAERQQKAARAALKSEQRLKVAADQSRHSAETTATSLAAARSEADELELKLRTSKDQLARAQQEARLLKERLEAAARAAVAPAAVAPLPASPEPDSPPSTKAAVLAASRSEELSRLADAHRTELLAIRTRLAEKESSLEVVHTELRLREQEIEALEKRAKGQSTRAAALQDKLAGEAAKAADLEASSDELQAQVTSLQAQLRDAEARLLTARQQGEAELASGQRRLEQAAQQQEDKVAALAAKVQRLGAEGASMAEGRTQAESQLKVAQTQLEEALSSKGRLQTLLTAADAKADALQEAHDGHKGRAVELDAESKSLNRQLAAAEQRLKELGEERSAWTGQDADRKAALDASAAEVQALGKAKAGLEAELRAVRGDLEAARAESDGQRSRANGLADELAAVSEASNALQAALDKLRAEHEEAQSNYALARLSAQTAEGERDEAQQALDTETRSRSQLGRRLIELQRGAAAFDERLLQERVRTKRALQRAQRLEKEGADRDGNQRLTIESLQREVQRLEAESPRNGPGVAALQREIEKLKRELLRAEELQGDAEARLHTVQRDARDLKQENASVAAQLRLAEVSSEELDAEREARRRAEAEADALRRNVAQHFVPKAQLRTYQTALEDRSRDRLKSRINEINLHLENNDLARELASAGAGGPDGGKENLGDGPDSDYEPTALAIGPGAQSLRCYKELWDAELRAKRAVGVNAAGGGGPLLQPFTGTNVLNVSMRTRDAIRAKARTDNLLASARADLARSKARKALLSA